MKKSDVKELVISVMEKVYFAEYPSVCEKDFKISEEHSIHHDLGLESLSMAEVELEVEDKLRKENPKLKRLSIDLVLFQKQNNEARVKDYVDYVWGEYSAILDKENEEDDD